MKCKYCQRYPCNKTKIIEDYLENIEAIVNIHVILAGCKEFVPFIAKRGDGL